MLPLSHSGARVRSLGFRSAAQLILLLLFLPLSVGAQISSRTEYYAWHSGSHSGSSQGQAAVSHTITMEGALAIQLHFSEIKLGENSYVTVTSLADGQSQTLDSHNISPNHSAMFNGDQVEISLFARAPDQQASIAIDRVTVQEPSFTTESICGPVDDRAPSNDPAVARLNNGCTAWIIANGKIVTAGHCTENQSSSSFIEFNVPLSGSGGQLQHPGPEHQYFMDIGSLNYVNGGPGADWAVFNVLNNSQTGLSPLQAQGKGFNVVQSAPGNTIRITGFGVDNGTANQTLQTHTGPLTAVTSERLFYATDTMGGNSGSPIIDNASGNAVGIHTHGGCSSTGGDNSGTRATVSALWAAMDLNNSPAGYTFCANEGGVCSFSGTASVAYGANGAFNYATASNGVSCSNTQFGDPIPGVGKRCYYRLTGNDITDLGGTISSQYNDWPAGEDIGNLIDNDTGSKYLTFQSSAWVQYQSPSAAVVTGYTLTSANDAPARDPLHWTLQGSNNGSNWVTLDSRNGEDFPNRLQTRSFSFSNASAYTHYRFNLTNNSGSILQLAEIELFANAGAFNQTIQAESYTAMSGVQTETTSDTGGGLNVGWIDTGDWMAFEQIATIPAAGNYRISYRVASVSGAELSADLNAGANQLGTVSIPATGGWQNWTTVSHDVQLPAGPINFGIYAPTSGWNLNWFRIESR